MERMASETSDAKEVVDGGARGGAAPDGARRELEEQFNVQRARMKELFLQKEETILRMVLEKEELESEVTGLRAEVQQLQVLSGNQQSEIQNLQLLVSETVEASSSGSEEARRLRARCLELEHQAAQLRHQLAQQQEVSLAPGMFVRSLARKLGADSEPLASSQPAEQPHQQQPRKKVEESELVRSIIEPLEQEIAALKTKLRDTDTQLQDTLKVKTGSTTGAAPAGEGAPESSRGAGAGGGGRQCDMCCNYEKQLVSEQAQADAARERAGRLEHALRLATDELEGVQALHDETVRAWHTERAAGGARLDELRAAVRAARAELEARAHAHAAAEGRALERVTTLTVDRETLQRKLDTLERDNAVLMGQYTKRAEEMQNEVIDLPDDIVELQGHALQLRERLIECAVGRERALEGEGELRAQLLEQGQLLHRQEAEMAATKVDLAAAREAVDRLQTEREQMKELGDKLRHSSDMIEQLLGDKKRLQEEVSELRNRVSVLQQELDNSEKVQQDFVRLSQSLQVQLQRIREADTEVRWQHDEDVSECPACRAPLHSSRKKVHCRHCGRIFCAACCAHSVPSGPRGAPARVCTVCRTLLQPHTAPYFSTDPPHTPD